MTICVHSYLSLYLNIMRVIDWVVKMMLKSLFVWVFFHVSWCGGKNSKLLCNDEIVWYYTFPHTPYDVEYLHCDENYASKEFKKSVCIQSTFFTLFHPIKNEPKIFVVCNAFYWILPYSCVLLILTRNMLFCSQERLEYFPRKIEFLLSRGKNGIPFIP